MLKMNINYLIIINIIIFKVINFQNPRNLSFRFIYYILFKRNGGIERNENLKLILSKVVSGGKREEFHLT